MKRCVPAPVRALVSVVPSAGPALAFALALALALAGGSGTAGGAPHAAPDAPDAMDAQVAAVLEALRDGDLAAATPLARALHRRFPEFALARLLYAELESVEALDGATLATDIAWSRRLIDLLAEARTRLDQATAPPDAVARATDGAPRPGGSRGTYPGDAVPRSLVALGDDVDHVVLVELSSAELRLYARGAAGRPELLERHYAGGGSGGAGKRVEGDLKTPLGVYRITGFRPDGGLPPLYGSGALTLDYPNALDRRLGRTGGGIWLHGVPPDAGSRAPRSSEGCVTMSNAHLDALVARLDRSRTLVVIEDRVRWSDERGRLDRRARHLATAGLPGSAAATLVEVPDLTTAPAHLAITDGAGGPELHRKSARPRGPRLRFVPLAPSPQASPEASLERLHASGERPPEPSASPGPGSARDSVIAER